MRHWKIRRFPSSPSRKTMFFPLELWHFTWNTWTCRRRWQGRWLWCQCHRHFVIGWIQWSDYVELGVPPPKKKLGHLQETKQEKIHSLGLPTMTYSFSVDIFLQASNPSMQPYNSSTCVDLWRGISWLAWANVSRRGVFPSVVWQLPCMFFSLVSDVDSKLQGIWVTISQQTLGFHQVSSHFTVNPSRLREPFIFIAEKIFRFLLQVEDFAL